MNDLIITTTVGEILVEEFMHPHNLSAYKIAKEIHVPVSRIQDIIHNRRRITPDTAIRLAKYFELSDKYFLDLQNDIDIRNLNLTLEKELSNIKPYKENTASI